MSGLRLGEVTMDEAKRVDVCPHAHDDGQPRGVFGFSHTAVCDEESGVADYAF